MVATDGSSGFRATDNTIYVNARPLFTSELYVYFAYKLQKTPILQLPLPIKLQHVIKPV